MNCKNKLFMTKRKAFTLIELLIVIAIIGILFIVLVSKVDFATDKAKATGVQTDFRSFQVAIESVAKENAGLAIFGWDTGDANGDRIRNSYDKGDANQNGVQDDGEVFVGSKEYSETWTNVYTLTNPADANDKSAIIALESAINANLDPKLHITIHDDLTITMTNGAQDPWNTEYHGSYITNATVDKKDRGAIIIYSNGANQEFGSTHSIANGVVTVNVPGNNVYGKDDYSIVSVYTYVNGYGEIKTTTTGFSNNHGGGQAGSEGTFIPGGGYGDGTGNGSGEESTTTLQAGLYETGSNYGTLLYTWDELFSNGILSFDGWIYDVENDSAFAGDLVLDDSVWEVGGYSFDSASGLTGVILSKNTKSVCFAFDDCPNLIYNEYENGLYLGNESNPYYALCGVIDQSVTTFRVHPDTRSINADIFDDCTELTNVILPDVLYSFGGGSFVWSESNIVFNEYNNGLYLGSDTNPYVAFIGSIGTRSGSDDRYPGYEEEDSIVLHKDTKVIVREVDYYGNITLNEGLVGITQWAFWSSDTESIVLPSTLKWLGAGALDDCDDLTTINIPNGIEYISPYCFQLCSSIVGDIYIPSSVKEIGEFAFSDCDSLESVSGGAGLERIDEYVFDECYMLKAINISAGNVYASKDGVLYTADYKILIEYPKAKPGTSFDIPSSVTTIGESAFENCLYLRRMDIPDNVVNIEGYAFMRTKLVEVNIGNGLRKIGEHAFSYCHELKRVFLSEGLTSIESFAFIDTYLASINIPSTVTSMASNSFGVTPRCYEIINLSQFTVNGTIVHTGESKVVQQGDYLFNTNNGINYLVGYIGTSRDLVLPDNYNGESYEIAPYAFAYSSIETVVISDGITAIGNYAFQSSSLKSITIGKNVATINEGTFHYVRSLKEIKFVGTTTEWTLITKGKNWKYNVSASQVVCSNGTTTLG